MESALGSAFSASRLVFSTSPFSAISLVFSCLSSSSAHALSFNKPTIIPRTFLTPLCNFVRLLQFEGRFANARFGFFLRAWTFFASLMAGPPFKP
ncbi:hypothetical protein RCL_jg14613.t2 [Rhizophagus clarus]|uniref:Uncharacterized protein n=1 Tax=Rhizophagus clarus TaxID=94130 RepID=A0A8H3QYE7_9GLOM|nr:hypothetical protein RCL_jg14613.t2 [Rhizophagus clarus]